MYIIMCQGGGNIDINKCIGATDSSYCAMKENILVLLMTVKVLLKSSASLYRYF